MTGSNIRHLLLPYSAGTLGELRVNIWITPPYNNATEDDMWKIEAVKKTNEAIYDRSVLPGFETEEVQDIQNPPYQQLNQF